MVYQNIIWRIRLELLTEILPHYIHLLDKAINGLKKDPIVVLRICHIERDRETIRIAGHRHDSRFEEELTRGQGREGERDTSEC